MFSEALHIFVSFFPYLDKICDMCDLNAECINNRCVCKQNYIGNGYHCTGDYRYSLLENYESYALCLNY